MGKFSAAILLAAYLSLADFNLGLSLEVTSAFAQESFFTRSEEAKPEDKSVATIHLITNENPSRSLNSLLSQLRTVSSGKYAQAGSVSIVTTTPPIEFIRQGRSKQLQGIIDRLFKENEEFSIKPVREAPAKYRLVYSPTWIIEHDGKTHIFEGNYNLSLLFGGDGAFRGLDAN